MKNTLALVAICVACLASAIDAQQVLHTVTGSAGDLAGAAMIDVGDQNGDGFADVLVGAPGFNAGRGAVYCISGRFLGAGAGPSTLWSITAPPVNANAAFGTSLASVGNLTGDSTTDFVIGAPNYIPAGAFDIRGAIFLVDGATHAIASFIHGMPQTHFGQVLVSVGDQNGDFKTDIAVSAPNVFTSDNWSYVHIVPGAAFGFATALASIPHTSQAVGWYDYGAALASGLDYDGDGKLDLALSIPSFGFANPESGWVEVCRATDLLLLHGYAPGTTGEHFGASIDASSDFDGDGVIDLVVGAPGWSNGFTETGRVRVVSGAKFNNPSLPGPMELFFPTLGFSSTLFDYHFGAAVRAGADLNYDGVDDILVGAPDYATLSGPTTILNKGLVAVFSGATGERIGLAIGGNTDALGDALVGAVDDFDSDGFVDFVVAGSRSDAAGTNCGTVNAYRLFPVTPGTYCTGKVNSLGCTPAISFSGSPSASSSAPYLITCASVINQKSGLLMYSHSPHAVAFQGGTLCVAAPIRRTTTQNSGGSASGNDCSGSFSFDFNAHIHGGTDPALVVGAEVFGQYWSRDSGSASNTSLSNALRLLINP